MIVHFGVSFSWKQLKKIILPVLIAIGLYFGFNLNVYASDTLLTYSHAGQQFYKSVCIEGDGFNSCTQYGQQGYQNIPWNDYYFLPAADPVYNAVYSFNQINVDSSGYDVKSNVFYKVVVTFEHGDLLTVDYNSWKNLKCGVYVNGQWDTKATSTCFGSYSNYTYTAFIRSDVPGTGLALFIGNTIDMSKSLLYSNVQDAYQQGARASSISVYSVDDNSGLLENIGNSIDNSTQDILNNNNQNTQDIINNQNQNTQDINDTLTDSNVDTGNANDFFSNFEDNDFGLSDIVKSPLVLIQGLTNGSSCQNLNLNVFGKDVSMPSGCILWNKVPPNIESIYFVFIGGFLAYVLGTKLFHDVNDLKNPEKSEVSTLDL